MSANNGKVWTRALGWVTPSEAKAMELKSYAREMPPSADEVALLKAGAVKLNPNRPKSLPAAPAQSGLHPLAMERGDVQAEFDALFAWVKAADDAPGRFIPRQEIERDMIAERVDLLRWYAFG